jgi:uncharacterized protein YigE (DUF2233 family)
MACCLLALLLAGCDSSTPAAQLPPPTRVLPTLLPTAAIAMPSAIPPTAPRQTPDSGWLAGANGVELRRLRLPPEQGQPTIPITIVRLDPAQVRLRVAYAPEQPRSIRAWFEERRPILAINGGFFTEDNRATALVISDGASSGASYEGFGGMLAVGQDGGVGLRALSDRPYSPDEALAQAIQSFPMLVFPGGQPAELDDDGRQARRTAVALDRAGRLLLLACPTSAFTLRGMADWLAASDLEIDSALNFDGGSSTGLYLQSGDLGERIDSFGPLPLVLLVEPR